MKTPVFVVRLFCVYLFPINTALERSVAGLFIKPSRSLSLRNKNGDHAGKIIAARTIKC